MLVDNYLSGRAAADVHLLADASYLLKEEVTGAALLPFQMFLDQQISFNTRNIFHTALDCIRTFTYPSSPALVLLCHCFTHGRLEGHSS